MSSVHVIFVHGFGSSRSTWDTLRQQLARLDLGMKSQCFEYETGIAEVNPTNAIPTLEVLGERFATYLTTLGVAPNEPLVLVGHSQGGLVLLAALAFRLQQHQAHALRQIAHCVLISTPTNGSDFFAGWRRVLGHVWPFSTTQEASLRPLNQYVGDLQRRIAAEVLFATSLTADACPIPITAIYGSEDAIVRRESARWIFTQTAAVPGNHFSVIRPATTEAAICARLRTIIDDAKYHVPPDGSLIRTLAIRPTENDLLTKSLELHDEHFTSSQSVRRDDAEYWLSHYKERFGIGLRMFAAVLNDEVRAFLMFHEDGDKDIAVVDYLVARGGNALDRVLVDKLVDRLRAVLMTSDVRTVVFEVARPVAGTESFKEDSARIRLFEQRGARVIPNLEYVAPSMDGTFSQDGEQPSLIMAGSRGHMSTTLPWSRVREIVEYLYKTWYRNWLSRRFQSDLPALEHYLNALTERVLVGVPLAGVVALEAHYGQPAVGAMRHDRGTMSLDR